MKKDLTALLEELASFAKSRNEIVHFEDALDLYFEESYRIIEVNEVTQYAKVEFVEEYSTVLVRIKKPSLTDPDSIVSSCRCHTYTCHHWYAAMLIALGVLELSREKANTRYIEKIEKGRLTALLDKENERFFQGVYIESNLEAFSDYEIENILIPEAGKMQFHVINPFAKGRAAESITYVDFEEDRMSVYCNCKDLNARGCDHMAVVLHFLSTHARPSLVDEITTESLVAVKDEHLQRMGLNPVKVNAGEYVEVFYTRDGLKTRSANKAQGVFDFEAIGEKMERELKARFAKPLKESFLPEATNIKEGNAFVFSLDFKRKSMDGFKLIRGRLNKHGDKLASHISGVPQSMMSPEEIEPFGYEAAHRFFQLDSAIHDAFHNVFSSYRRSENEDIIHRQNLALMNEVAPTLLDQILYYTKNAGYGDVKRSDLKRVENLFFKVKIEFFCNEEDHFYKILPIMDLDGKRVNIDPTKSKLFFPGMMLYGKSIIIFESFESFKMAQLFDRSVIRAPKQQLPELYRHMLKPLSDKYPMKYARSMKVVQNALYVDKLELHVSEMGEHIMLDPKVLYDNGEIYSIFDDGTPSELSEQGKIIQNLRNKKVEDEFAEMLCSLHPSFRKQLAQGRFFISMKEFAEDYWFMDFVDELERAGVEVVGMNALERFEFVSEKPQVTMELISKQDWFETTVRIAFGNQQISLDEIKKALKENRNTITLQNGKQGIIPRYWMERFEKLFRSGNQEGDKVKISKMNFNDLEHLVDQEAITLEIRQELREKQERLATFDSIKEVSIPSEVRADLREYQKMGVNWLNFLDEYRWGGILADDMGLGKTLQVLTFLQMQINRHPEMTNLVVVPTSLLFNWRDEMEKFTPSIDFVIHHGLTRSKKIEELTQHQLVVTSYGTMTNDTKMLGKHTFNYLILDESQAIKNWQSQRAKSVRELKANNRIAMTGTPIENNTMELYSQMQFLNPGFLHNATEFKRMYSRPIEMGGNLEIAEELKKRITPFILRRTKKEVLKELPDKTEEVLYCVMGEEQRQVYDAYRNRYRDFLLKKIDEDGIGNSQIFILEGLTKLRQICDSPQLISKDTPDCTESVKIQELIRHLKENTGSSKVLIFSQFVSMLSLIQAELEHEGITYEYLDGKTPQRKRELKVNRFEKDRECKVFLISLKAGGTGLNLTSAEYVYLVDPWWNPAVENQAIDRAYRMGQTRKVFAYRMICKNTVEEKILKLQHDKKNLSDEIIVGDGTSKKLSREDVAALFN